MNSIAGEECSAPNANNTRWIDSAPRCEAAMTDAHPLLPGFISDPNDKFKLDLSIASITKDYQIPCLGDGSPMEFDIKLII
jgi:hypothetical protein